jgi:hypothetical protein
MHVFFHKGEQVFEPQRQVQRIVVYPHAEQGAGTIQLYDDQGKTIAIILLRSLDHLIILDPPNYTPEQLELMPEPIQFPIEESV